MIKPLPILLLAFFCMSSSSVLANEISKQINDYFILGDSFSSLLSKSVNDKERLTLGDIKDAVIILRAGDADLGNKKTQRIINATIISPELPHKYECQFVTIYKGNVLNEKFEPESEIKCDFVITE